MIVSCESCQSKYKLDDAKITGRGAKITCPRCKHAFVVYAQSPGDAARHPPAPGRAADPPTPTVNRVAQLESDEEEVTGQSRANAPPFEEVTRKPQPQSVHAPPAGSPPAAAPAAALSGPKLEPGELAARAAALDFRKVGVTTWKVKVKIGLIYDFSDIRTLRKYIQDGRVTPADVVSWDGKAWALIGEIPDLDAFFVETWDMLAARRGDEPPPPPPAPRGQEPEATPAPPKNGGEPDRFNDPFEDLKRKQRDRVEQRRSGGVSAPTKKPAESAPNRAPLLAAAGLLLATALGAGWWFTRAPVAPPEATAPAPAIPPPGGDGRSIKERMDQEIRESIAKNPAPPPVADEEPTLTPINRGAQAGGAPPPAPGMQSAPAPGMRTAPSAVPSAVPSAQQRDATAADHEALGDDAAKQGDWGMAITAYEKAVSMNGSDGRLLTKLGKAQYQAGDYGGAQGTLEKATKSGSKDATKYLGDVARAQGDLPGAKARYEQYLKGSPRDAPEIQKLIRSLGGG